MTSDRPVAAFDFDGTLTRRDTLVPFLASVASRTALLRAVGPMSWDFVRGDRDAAKERLLTGALRGRDPTEIVAAGREYGARLVRRSITSDARERLEWHRREGHRVVIVSASLDVYLEEVARVLEIDDVVCTRLEVDDAGRYTGRMLGGNCRGVEKARRLRTRIGAEVPVLWAYGNAASDDEMLALAANPVRVRRGRLSA